MELIIYPSYTTMNSLYKEVPCIIRYDILESATLQKTFVNLRAEPIKGCMDCTPEFFLFVDIAALRWPARIWTWAIPKRRNTGKDYGVGDKDKRLGVEDHHHEVAIRLQDTYEKAIISSSINASFIQSARIR